MTDVITKPCPFCGQPATSTKTYIGCLSCDIGSSINPPYGSNERQAWNTRTPDTAQLVKERSELEILLLKALRYFADLNGSAWIKGDDAGSVDMRQRSKALQKAAYDRLSPQEQEHKT